MDELEDIQKYILRKLMRLRMWGGKHTSVDNLPKGLAKHLRGIAKEIIQDLIKSEILLSKPTNQGAHVSLNPRAMERIKKVAGIDII